MTALQITLIAAIVVPALVIVLWPLLGGRPGAAAPSPGRASDDRRLELDEEKAALYRALRELEFDHDAGHLSDPDFQSLRERYESRAGVLITELDLLRGGPEMAPALPQPRTTVLRAERASWTRHPATFAAGAAVLVIFGVIIGVNAGRFTERDETFTPPGARIPVPGPPPSPVGPPTVRLEPGKPIPPEMLAGMLQAARQSLFEGRYSEAIAAYQAVLKRDERNVDAMTTWASSSRSAATPTPRWRPSTRRSRSTPSTLPPISTAARCSTSRSRTTRARWPRGSASWRWCPRARIAIASPSW